jgi:Flp pilus assembly protein TadD
MEVDKPAQISFWSNPFFRQPRGVGLICFFLFGLTAWTFWPSLNGQFLFHDEFGNLIVNKHVNSGLTWNGVIWALFALDYNQWIPLSWISHMLDFQIYGATPYGHHLTNVLLHAVTAVLLFLLLKKMTGALWRSLIVAGMFAFHPLRVESVAWISERKDILSAFFGFLALWTYTEYSIRAKSRGTRLGLFYGLTYLFFALSLLSKQTLITFPCLLLLLDYWPLGRWQSGNIRRLILEKIPFFIVLPFVSKISYLAQFRGGALDQMAYLTWDARFENALVSYARYLGKMLFPSDLSSFYPHPVYWPGAYVLMAGLLFVGLSALAWLMRREWHVFFVGWFWFVGTSVPVIGFVQLYSIAMADRFTYFPGIGIAVILVWGVFALTKRWRSQASFGGLAAALLLLIYIALTRYQISFWKDDVTLLSRAVAVNDDNYIAHCLLGFMLNINSSDPDRAFGEFQKSADLNPLLDQAQLSLGDNLLQRGRLNEAIMHYQAASDINPHDMRSVYGLGVAWFQKGKVDEGLRLCRKAYDKDLGNMQYLNGLIAMLVQKNRFADAVPLLKTLCQSNPSDPNAFNGLGFVLVKTSHFDEAIVAFQAALKLAPDSPALQGNLAAAINAKQQNTTNNVPAAFSPNQPLAN